MKGTDEHPSRRPNPGRSSQCHRAHSRLLPSCVRPLRHTASRDLLHDHDQGDVSINDKQRRLVDQYSAEAYDHLSELDFLYAPDVDDKSVVEHLTAARNKLNVCIAILYDDAPIDGRATAARPSNGGPTVDDD